MIRYDMRPLESPLSKIPVFISLMDMVKKLLAWPIVSKGK